MFAVSQRYMHNTTRFEHNNDSGVQILSPPMCVTVC